MPPVLFKQPPALSSVCAQRRADNPGQDNKNRPPFVSASMSLVTVPVNSGHRQRPGRVSCTKGPLTRGTSRKVEQTVFEYPVSNAHTHTNFQKNNHNLSQVCPTKLNILAKIHKPDKW